MNNEETYKIGNVAGHLAKMFLKNPLTPVIAGAILLLGFISLEIMPREEDPQISVSGGSVIVPIPGATPEEINNVVVKPLERRIREIKGVEHIFSTAMNNAGMLNVQYFIGENREDSNLKLYDKVMQNMDQLPNGTMPPLIKPFDIDIDIPILTVTFYKKSNADTSHAVMYKTIRQVQQSINSLDSVSKTELKGIKRPQFNIFVNLNKLSGYQISLGQVAQSIRSISTNAPNIDNNTRDGKLIVFGIRNAINDIDDIHNLIIAQYMGAPIYLRNIARVEYGYDVQKYQSVEFYYQSKDENNESTQTQQEHNKENNQEKNNVIFKKAGESVTMTISKLKGTNAVNIAQSAIEELSKSKTMLNERGMGYYITRNYGDRANEAVNELVHHLEITILIIALILIPFLGWRESVVVTIAVPMILATTLFIALMTDQTINRITLFAFLLSLGLIVDDAIIVIENIHRRLHMKETKDQSFERIIIEATDEIGPSTNIATIAIMLTMIPMGFVGGMMGQFMLPIPLNVPVGLAVSLFVAYVFAPYLAYKFLKFERHDDEHEDIPINEEKH